MTDLYRILGVDQAISHKGLLAQGRRRLAAAHPDSKSGDPEVFARLLEAYDVLSDPERRKVYDESLCALSKMNRDGVCAHGTASEEVFECRCGGRSFSIEKDLLICEDCSCFYHMNK